MAGRGKSPRGRGQSQKIQHPGEVLAQILEDTELSAAAGWFGLSKDAVLAVLEGKAPMTREMAVTAGTIFGTGSAPWIEMQAAWDEAHKAPEEPGAGS